MESFPKEVEEALKYYVYKLIDPRDGCVFYVGKGKGSRVFAHCAAALEPDDVETDIQSEKIETIREIILEGLTPLHIIARHGVTEDRAFLVEAALIDNTPGLTNIAGGHGSSEHGPASAEQLVSLYSAEEIVLEDGLNVMAINVSKSTSQRGLYDAVRFAWRVSLQRAERADLVFAVSNGLCRVVFIPEHWLPATRKNFPELTETTIKGRYGFIGTQASMNQLSKYRLKRMPAVFKRKRGAASPILYNYT